MFVCMTLCSPTCSLVLPSPQPGARPPFVPLRWRMHCAAGHLLARQLGDLLAQERPLNTRALLKTISLCHTPQLEDAVDGFSVMT
jgi:hypothetical protein